MSDFSPQQASRYRAYRGPEPFVFVSYSHREEELIEQEIAALASRGVRIYYDEGIDAGREWPEELANAVQTCSVFLFFVSQHSVASRTCRGELAVALQADRPILPVQIDDTELPPALRLQIGNRQAIVRSRFTQAEYRDRLAASLLAFQNAPPTARRNDADDFDGIAAKAMGRTRRVAPAAYAVVAALVTVAAILIWRLQIVSDPMTSAAPIKREGLVVLPFENGSGRDSDAYLSEGFSDELRDQLSRVRGLRVVARASSVVFAGQRRSASDIAAKLGVASVVEGSLRKEGDSLRVAVRLVDGVNDRQLWSESYDRKSSDLLAIQQEVALAAARQILPQLDPTEVPRPEWQASVHDLMLLARNYAQSAVTPKDWDRVVSLYQKVIAVDPDSAAAHARLAKALLLQGVDIEAAETHARRSLELNPDLAEGHAVLGFLLWSRFRGGSGQEYERAVALNPNDAEALHSYGEYLNLQRREKSFDYLRRARDLDPMSLRNVADLAYYYAAGGHVGDWGQVATSIEQRFPEGAGLFALSRTAAAAGALDQAIAWGMQARQLDPHNPEVSRDVAEWLARLGLDAESSRVDPEPSLRVLFWQRRYDAIIERMSKADLDEADGDSLGYLAFALQATGRDSEAVSLFEMLGLPGTALDDDLRRWRLVHDLANMVGVLHAVRDERTHDVALWLEQFARKRPNDEIGLGWARAWWNACPLAVMGKKEEALQQLEESAAALNLAWLPFLRDAACFRDLHDEPRYRRAIQTLQARHDAIRGRLPATLEQRGLAMDQL